MMTNLLRKTIVATLIPHSTQGVSPKVIENIAKQMERMKFSK